MRNFILFFAAMIILYGCIELSGKEPGNHSASNNIEVKPDNRLRVGKAEGNNMRGRRGQDTTAVKISFRDLEALMAGSQRTVRDSLIFYFVKYDSPQDRDRYLYKVPSANWNSIRGKSSVLVGFLGSPATGTMSVTPRRAIPGVSLYDLGVVCPPPANCDCEIEQ